VLGSWLGVAVAGTSLGCSPSYHRGSETEGLDDPAMSTGLDKRDLQQLMHENMKKFVTSQVAHEWNAAAEKPRVAVFPLTNDTSEHVDSQLWALLSDIEGYLVESRLARVVSLERQDQMMAEVDKQHAGGFDPERIAEINKQLGTQYYFTGKVQDASERTDEGRRVQYFMHLQVIDVATSEVRWQNKAELTKAILD
jgi:PBP1b-binding outer membrane lipoprotein LpoB